MTHLSAMPFFAWMNDLLGGSPVALSVLGMILTIAVAIVSNAIYNELELSTKRDYLSALLFCVLISVSGYSSGLDPALCSLLLSFLAIRKVCRIGDSKRARYVLFDAGLLTGTATLFYANSIFILIPAMAMIQIIRSFNWRDHAAMIVGALTPMVLFFLLTYATGWDTTMRPWTPTMVPWNGYSLTSLIVLVALFLISVPAAVKEYGGSIMRIKNLRAGMAGFMLVFAALGLIEMALQRPAWSTLLAVPTSYYAGFFFRNVKPGIIRELVFTLLLTYAIWIQWS